MSESVVPGTRVMGKIERFAYEVFQWTIGDIELVFSSRQAEVHAPDVINTWMGTIRLNLQYESSTWNLWVTANLNPHYHLRFPILISLVNCKAVEIHILYISNTIPRQEIKQFVHKTMKNQPAVYDFQKPLTIKVEVKPVLEDIFDASLNLELKGFVDSRVFSDVRIIVDGLTLFAHRVILSAASSYFAERFERMTLSRTETTIVKIKGITAGAVKELLRFIYTGKIENLDVHKRDLLLASVTYDLPKLTQECEKHLYRSMNAKNVSEHLDLAKEYKFEAVESRAAEFIRTLTNQKR